MENNLPEKVEIVGVKFKSSSKIYYFSPKGMDIKKGQFVVVETARGMECGEIAKGNTLVDASEVVQPLKNVIRIATDEDIKKLEENKKKEEEAFKICSKKISEHKLEMCLTDVEYTFDNSKILFYFTADGRIDFRELVKDLAAVFRTRIELRQIGVRDEAKMLGGLGICGKEFCCSSFLGDFQPVSIKMAKDQGLSLNPGKISGTCGRLMCCLKYEQDVYEELLKIVPTAGCVVNTPEGKGVVAESNLLTGAVKVRLDKNADGAPRSFNSKEIKVLKRARSNDEKLSEELSDLE